MINLYSLNIKYYKKNYVVWLHKIYDPNLCLIWLSEPKLMNFRMEDKSSKIRFQSTVGSNWNFSLIQILELSELWVGL